MFAIEMNIINFYFTVYFLKGSNLIFPKYILFKLVNYDHA
jgi:hypothetical protein